MIEVRLEGAVQAQVREPVPAGDGLHPVGLATVGRGRPVVEVDRTIGVGDEIRIARAAITALLLVVDQAARIDVVDGDRPEQLGRNIFRQVQLVVSGAVQEIAVGVPESIRVLGADVLEVGGVGELVDVEDRVVDAIQD